MLQHPYFDLMMHDDLELSHILGAKISERNTLHEWPLSCVQRLTLESGRRVIYKATAGPTLETEFATMAHSPLLVPVRTIYQRRGYRCLLIEYIHAPLLQQQIPDRIALAQIAVRLTRQIEEIEGDLPCYLDIRGTQRWRSFRQVLLEALQRLVNHRLYTAVTDEAIERLAAVMDSEIVAETIAGRQAYLHGDLKPENIFVTASGLRVIDWQRPIRGPARLDQVELLEAAGYGPENRAEIGAILVATCLRIYWFVACTMRWFPPGRETYDSSVATLIEKAVALK